MTESAEPIQMREWPALAAEGAGGGDMSVRCFVALGDSFSAGTEQGVEPFPDRVASLLPGSRYLNLACDGARSADVEAGQLEPALAAAPDLVSVVCGANDVVATTRPAIDEFGASFERILTALGDRRVVTATYPAVAELLALRPRTRERMSAGLDAVNAHIRRLSERHGATCLDLAGHEPNADPANFADDGFHPSALGHRRAAEAFGAVLRDRLGIELDGGAPGKISPHPATTA
ncbi:MAG: SGNH/GDSL hydrolase family protein [Actinomycetota bacterium]|nr:SGNH/GDSL hydrolase family protein [Actinomycetota bacterium]